MARSFRQAAELINDLQLFHAGLFVFGLTFMLAPQRSLKPAGPCAEELYYDYETVIMLTYFLLLTTFIAAALSSHVRRSVPDAGLHHVIDTRARLMLRFNAAFACVFSCITSVNGVTASTYLVLAKLGAFGCRPAWFRTVAYIIYAGFLYAVVTVYYHTGRSMLLAD